MLPDTLRAYIFNTAFPHGLLRAEQILHCDLEITKPVCRKRMNKEITAANSER